MLPALPLYQGSREFSGFLLLLLFYYLEVTPLDACRFL